MYSSTALKKLRLRPSDSNPPKELCDAIVTAVAFLTLMARAPGRFLWTEPASRLILRTWPIRSRSTLPARRRHLRLDTLVRLRWLAITGQTAAVAMVQFGFGFPLPFGLCFVVIAASAWVNLALGSASRRATGSATMPRPFFSPSTSFSSRRSSTLPAGLQNPFSMLFLAPVLISATALTPERTLGLGLLAVGSATLLVLVHRPLPWFPGETLTLPFAYVTGIWTAILLGTAFTGVYAWRVAEEARQLAQALAATELVLAREQHLSQLDGLAAAAAHELGTPLATIALVAKELDHAMPQDGPIADDLKLLREQVERCRTILSKLTSMGQDQSAFLETISLTHLVEEIVAPQRALGIEIEVSSQGRWRRTDRAPQSGGRLRPVEHRGQRC